MKSRLLDRILIFFMLPMCTANAWGGLVSGVVKGAMRYCRYSDSGVITVPASTLFLIENSSKGSFGGSPSVNIDRGYGGMGTLESGLQVESTFAPVVQILREEAV